MTTPDVDYLALLDDLSRGNADLLSIRAHHYQFWSKRASQAPSLGPSHLFRAYFLGTVPSALPSTWFLDPQVYLQRIGLYADVFVFDDIVGNVLAKVSHVGPAHLPMLGEQVSRAIRAVTAIGPIVRAGLVQFLPTDEFSSEPHDVALLDALTMEQGAEDLPDILRGMLTPEQQATLGETAGHAILHQVNRALSLQTKRAFVPAADDTCFRILREKAARDRRELGDTNDLYVLRQLRPEYLCQSTALMLELRKDDKVRPVREFLRKRMRELFARAPDGVFDQAVLDEFSRGLDESYREVLAELAALRRKFSHDLIQKLTSTAVAAGITIELGVGSSAPGWLPVIAKGLTAYSGSSVMECIKDYLRERKALRSKPAFLLGANLT